MFNENEAMWRKRFAECGPIVLVSAMQDIPVPDIQRWAGEELDKQLLERGFKPNRPSA